MNIDGRIPLRSSSILERALSDELVVMSDDGRFLYTFSGTARFIWERIDGLRSLAAILRALTEEYAIEESVARHDFDDFIMELSNASLIRLT